MTTYIRNFTNNSAGAVVLADIETGGSVAIPPTPGSNTVTLPGFGWAIKDHLAQAILGPGPTNVGPGTYEWIWDDGNYNILLARAGLWLPFLLIHLPTGSTYYQIDLTYNPARDIEVQLAGASNVASGMAEHELAH
ncbi:hypothetical protein RZS28_04735 [Methylocapsa polymorpha]|uniref:Uncharacterized protein n=1 Tax=Methylocapsa polymorpha TaxID=3080828 RepID=A0ABZ0HW20_9HYPH|nr:hypothetical protein RZS28_04735 [Methylocapsa sp. RX1]